MLLTPQQINALYTQGLPKTPLLLKKLKAKLEAIILNLQTGTLKVAEYHQGVWQTHEWLKQAILLYFKTHQNERIDGGPSLFYDKIPLQFGAETSFDFKAHNARIVPYASIRAGAYIGPNCVLMPSFINIGAHVGAGCMIDTWATVGACAQIGKKVHLSGGAGIGGVLEPLQANPTIIEDNCFIGARSEIVEGVIVEENSVISMGVFIGQSTKIFNRETAKITYGRIPKGSVVVPGSLPSSHGCHLNCAVIVKQIDAKTRQKVAINELLRESV